MTRREIVERVRRAPGLRRLSVGVVRELVAAARLRELRRGELLFEEGEPGEHVFLVLRGTLRVRKALDLETSAPVALRGALEWIGELALEPGELRSASADAEGSALLLEIPRAVFVALLREHPDLAIDLLHFVARRLRESDRALVDSLRKRTEQLLARNQRLGAEVERLRGQDPMDAFEGFVGSSQAAQRVRSAARRASRNERPVLLVGERGTGKELLAGLIHRASERSPGPLVAFDCSLFEGPTLEADLFGHARGGLPGAARARPGALAEARGGTLYLARVEVLPAPAQHALFRLLETGEYQRVGETRLREADVRLIAGSETAVGAAAQDAVGFRADLLSRLAGQCIELPPLRARREDLALLLACLAETGADRRGSTPLRFEPSAVRALAGLELPGNADELVALLEPLLATHPPDASVGPGDLGTGPGIAATPARYSEAVRAFKIELIRQAVREAGGNRAKAASRLGIHRSNLSRMMKELGLTDWA